MDLQPQDSSQNPAVFRKGALALTSPGTLYLWSTRPVWQSITQTASPPHVATIWDVALECPVLWDQPHKHLFFYKAPPCCPPSCTPCLSIIIITYFFAWHR